MLILIIGGGLFLLLDSKGFSIKKINKGFSLLLKKNSEKGISRFEALSAVLASTVGLGNISGVAIAIHMGGPGVLVWMWITALLGSVIKFYSCTLSVKLRRKELNGEPLGGPMYYMTIGMPRSGKFLANWFCVAALFGVLPAFTANQLTQTVVQVIYPSVNSAIDSFIYEGSFGLLLILVSGWVILGGLKKIVKTTSKLVPLMVILYLLMGLWVIIHNITQIPYVLQTIIFSALDFKTMYVGGFWGLVLLGIRRAVFSNESGIGNAPMYHGQSQTKEPINEGLVASLGPLLDTILVCSITGIVIIVSGSYLDTELNGILLTLESFNRLFYGLGDTFLVLMVIVFGITTLFTYSYYGVKCLDFLTKKKYGFIYNYVYLTSIFFSAISSVNFVISLIDLSFALMAIPNMISVIYLSKLVKQEITKADSLEV
ncbi:MAG: alanine:cation symporter family protein [Flavobacteriales bacterium]|nr:MAG: alanine:cation symporter family protein [Flavobacteriales bacterium TMED96]RPG56673.1 MAG: alanine:cation symporter family protein [Flavobacteriales bacterium TMED96]RZP10439.1 MAG: alanine:cation symporter family protein [Flavobacteriales bacterium]